MQHRVRVKICGITSVADAGVVCSAGADAIGLVFYASSPRYVDTGLARDIVLSLPPFVTATGLFVDAAAAEVEDVLRKVPLDLLQFHGHEEESFCKRFERPYIKAVRVRDETDLARECHQFSSAAGILLDSYRHGVPGGTGETFDWHAVPSDLPLPLVLAGGLNAANVVSAVAALRPWAVDVSSGVESVPGQKDTRKIIQFMAALATINQA